jgi:hypothetical protein
MKQPATLLRESEERLNKALADYEAPPSSTLAREFYELRIQAAIFNYDVTYDVVSLWRHEPSGFAEKVALKSLVHKLYEYDELLSKHLVARILELAHARSVHIRSTDIKAERRKWSAQLVKLQSWSGLRNQATGHYGKDTAAQVALLKHLRRDQVMNVAAAFLSFNITVLKVLANAGRG